MAVAIGSKEGQREHDWGFTGISVADAAGDDETIIVEAGKEGYLDINHCRALITTAVVSTTTDGVINIRKGATVIGTATLLNGTAKNTLITFTPATGFEQGVNFTAGDTIVIASTLAVGTPAGVATVFLALDMN